MPKSTEKRETERQSICVRTYALVCVVLASAPLLLLFLFLFCLTSALSIPLNRVIKGYMGHIEKYLHICLYKNA